MNRKPASSARPFIVSDSMPDDPGPVRGAHAQRVEKLNAASGNSQIGQRPAAYVLDDHARSLYRRWVQGKRIRQLARNHGTTVDDMEQIIRRMAA